MPILRCGRVRLRAVDRPVDLQHVSGMDPAIVMIMQPPTAEQAEDAVRRTKRLYHRALTGWASDLLRLRRAGLTQITWSPSRRPAGGAGGIEGVGPAGAGADRLGEAA